jgi:hypothetical protein
MLIAPTIANASPYIYCPNSAFLKLNPLYDTYILF